MDAVYIKTKDLKTFMEEFPEFSQEGTDGTAYLVVGTGDYTLAVVGAILETPGKTRMRSDGSLEVIEEPTFQDGFFINIYLHGKITLEKFLERFDRDIQTKLLPSPQTPVAVLWTGIHEEA